VLVAPGTYREVLAVDKPNIQIRSADTDASKTVVVNDRSAGANGGTLHSATVNVTADNFLAENITFQNDFNRTHAQVFAVRRRSHSLSPGIAQSFATCGSSATRTPSTPAVATALRMRDCIPARQYFTDCYIAGNVDFIFGDGKAVFDHCEIHSTPHAGGYITAQAKHYPEEDSGSSSTSASSPPIRKVTNFVYLGRPWRPYATVSISIPRWTIRSIRQDGANGIPAKRIPSKPSSTPSTAQPAPEPIEPSAIRTPTSLLPNKPNNLHLPSFSVAAIIGIHCRNNEWIAVDCSPHDTRSGTRFDCPTRSKRLRLWAARAASMISVLNTNSIF